MAGLKVAQINLQHCRAATAALSRCLDVGQTQIALIQEPWTFKSQVKGLGLLKGTVFVCTSPNAPKPRTCVYVTKGIKASLMRQFSGADLTAVQIVCNEENSQ